MPKKNNILISSAGRRVELINAFKNEASLLNINGSIFATDLNPNMSSACHVADLCFPVPRVNDPDFITILKKICLDNQISMVVPTIDTELLLLSQHKKDFANDGINIIISDEPLIKICRDKRLTGKLFSQLGIKYPKIYNLGDIEFPCFCKPYDGSCSAGAQTLHSKNMLTPEIVNNPKNMFMELISKEFAEFTIDAYYDKENVLKSLVPRKRIETRGGEVSKGITRKGFVYNQLLEKLAFLDGAIGCITFQFFVNETSEEIIGLEINPRFGGGYPLSYSAGASYPNCLINEYLLDKKIPFNTSWQEDLVMLRYDAHIIFQL